jgi:hypothetical protein
MTVIAVVVKISAFQPFLIHGTVKLVIFRMTRTFFTKHYTAQILRIFNTNVKAVLLYICETWKNSKSVTATLQVFINKCLRKILQIFWPDQIMNNELWKHTKQPRIDLQIRKRKWGWLGHTLRKPSDDIARQALE